jgi:hypothetical protein
LDSYLDQRIYVVQGANVTNSFPWSYCGIDFCEGNLAISGGTVNTNWFGNSQGASGTGGQYTLTGTPTGVSWNSSPPPPGTTGDIFYDGTSDGVHNYTVENAATSAPTQVVATDLHWQNPTALFPVALPGGNLAITYDPIDNALWIGDGNGTMAEYSLTGTLLTSFTTGHTIVALAYDQADNTLWSTVNSTTTLYQYSKAGVVLQSGSPAGLPTSRNYFSGEIAGPSVSPIPEPASLALLGSGLAGLWVALRRRNRLVA